MDNHIGTRGKIRKFYEVRSHPDKETAPKSVISVIPMRKSCFFQAKDLSVMQDAFSTTDLLQQAYLRRWENTVNVAQIWMKITSYDGH